MKTAFGKTNDLSRIQEIGIQNGRIHFFDFEHGLLRVGRNIQLTVNNANEIFAFLDLVVSVSGRSR